MWGKREQYYIWICAYLPFILLMTHRYLDSNKYFGTNLYKFLDMHLPDSILIY